MAKIILEEVSNALFFTSISGDRAYTAKDFVSYLGSTMGNGIVDLNDEGATVSGPFCAANISGTEVTINPGSAILGGNLGYMARQTSSKVIDFTNRPTGAVYRWDRVVLSLDNTQAGANERTIKFAVIEGTSTQPNSSTYDLTQEDVTNGGVYELLLFDVRVPGDGIGSGNEPVSVDYTYSPYALYENKQNKTSDIPSNLNDMIKYVTPKAVADYSIPRSGGSSYPVTGNIYMGGYSFYDVGDIFSKAGEHLLIEATGSFTGNQIQLKVADFDGLIATFGYLDITFNQITKHNNGIRTNSNPGGYSFWAETGNSIFDGNVELNSTVEFNSTVSTNIDMNNNKLINAKVQRGYIGTDPQKIWTADTAPNENGLLLDGETSSPGGESITVQVPTGTLWVHIHFSIAPRNTSSPFEVPYGVAVASVPYANLARTGAPYSTFSATFVNDDEVATHMITAKVSYNYSTTTFTFTDPRTFRILENSSITTFEKPIYIQDIYVTYNEGHA